jgi:hypothetical protein
MMLLLLSTTTAVARTSGAIRGSKQQQQYHHGADGSNNSGGYYSGGATSTRTTTSEQRQRWLQWHRERQADLLRWKEGHDGSYNNVASYSARFDQFGNLYDEDGLGGVPSKVSSCMIWFLQLGGKTCAIVLLLRYDTLQYAHL